MPNILQRLQLGLQAATGARDTDDVEQRLTALMRQKGMPPANLDVDVSPENVVTKSRSQWERQSLLDAHKDDVLL